MTASALSHPFTFDVEGMTCAACSSRIEKVLAATPGVRTSQVNLALERADVSLEEGVDPSVVLTAISEAGYEASLRRQGSDMAAQERAREAHARNEAHREGWHLAVALLLALPLVAPMLLTPFGIDLHLKPSWQWLLATPVQFGAGFRFYRGAWRAVRSFSANMDVLVALGTGAAYAFSAVAVIRLGDHAHDHLYFESGAVVIVALLAGKLLEARAKGGTAAAVRALLKLQPPTARRLVGESASEVKLADLRSGDRIEIRPGDLVPVDGVVEDGISEVNEALLTGESLPVRKTVAARVIAGTQNGTGRLVVRATAIGEDSVLARMSRAVERAQNARPPVQSQVDRVTSIFVPVVLALALTTFLGWLMLTGDLEQALIPAVSVLVIACPCALGLATPTAIVAGIGAAARAGILLREPAVIERAGLIDTVVFDKTGTLTIGHPRLLSVTAVPDDSAQARDRLLRLAASAQRPSEHVLGRALISAALERGVAVEPPAEFVAVPGGGIRANVGQHRLVIGTAALIGDDGGEAERLAAVIATRGETPVLVAIDGRFSGAFGLADAMRETASAAVDALKMAGIRTILLSGDRPETVAAMAARLMVDEAHGGIDPRGKSAFIAGQKAAGRQVAMVGDGVNDALALAEADIGIAMGSGSDVAIEAADVALMRDEPRLVAAALDIAARTKRKISHNLLFAFVYNVIGIPLAMAGALSPAFAGAAMALSSVSVLASALMLTLWRPVFLSKNP
ncbi:heavy metal translocating P-type ATPase [Candidatus Raskinella chloraquaticus]|uniref:P-type Cu(+) transporter n=1 Tax=Candidatus Raskinella chloraquaticus TaxID=1951219 RepID=A0A1W9HQC4_9HYPH|nr:MAG: hypothetical protein A4S15_01545 [Proteobacteria bacterium SG_bin8]